MTKDVLYDSADRVSDYLAQKERIGQLLEKQSGLLISSVVDYISLRELGRRTDLSPTYLSRVWNGYDSFSPEAFMKVASVLRRLEDSE